MRLGCSRRCLACLAAPAAFWAHRQGLQLSDLDPRTPWWLRLAVLRKPWRHERAECAEGATCAFEASQFWTPGSRSPDHAQLADYFARASPGFASREQAILVALHRRFLRRSPLFGGPAPPLGLFQVGSYIPAEGEVAFVRSCSAAFGGSAHWVLVEPQEPIIEDVRASALSAGLGPERTTVINAAMCPSADKELELWRFKSGTIEHPALMEECRKWSTLGGKDVLIDTWRRITKLYTILYGWQVERLHSDDIEDWVEPVPVRCHTPATLLRELRMEAASVDYLLIDAEGYDAEILALFGDLPGFNPAVIVLEYGFSHASRGKAHLLPELADFWSRRGYAVHKDHDNLVIFKTDGS